VKFLQVTHCLKKFPKSFDINFKIGLLLELLAEIVEFYATYVWVAPKEVEGLVKQDVLVVAMTKCGI